jgi:predicted transcriptional regulator
MRGTFFIKENVMPDMKTALSGILSEWELDNQQQEKQVKHQPHFKVTNNVTRATFDYVKNNPNQPCRIICAELEKQGFKSVSVTSLLTQFVKNRLCIRDEQGRYTAIVNEYSPIKVRKQLKAKQAKQVIEKAKATRGEGIAALSPQPTPRVAPIVTAWDADTIINNIGLKQARALYDELKKIFGG